MTNRIDTVTDFSLPLREYFPSYFLEELKKENDKHELSKETSPTALVLIAKDDYKGVFYTAAHYFFLLNIAKTHRVAIKIIDDKNNIKSFIDGQAKLFNKKIDLLVIEAHGSKKSMTFAKDSVFKEEDIKEDIFENISKEGKIFLNACDAGKVLAKRIADVSNKEVFAPIRWLSQSQIIYSLNQEGLPEISAYDQKGEYIFVFKKKLPPRECCVSAKNVDTYRGLLREYLSLQAKSGKVDSQCQLAHLFLIEGKIKEAKFWYLKAEKSGNLTAKNQLGEIFESEGNISEAIKMYSQSASLGNLIARMCLKKIADKGNCSAQYELAFLYMKLKNIEKAKEYYFLASESGNLEARLGLYMIYHDECLKNNDQKSADEWLVKFSKIQYEVGLSYLKKGDKDLGLRVIEKSAEKGFLEAKQFLANFYLKSIEFEKSKVWLCKILDNESEILIRLDCTFKLIYINFQKTKDQNELQEMRYAIFKNNYQDLANLLRFYLEAKEYSMAEFILSIIDQNI